MPAMDTTTSASPPLGAQLRALASDIKLAHSVFALPFALFASVMAADVAGAGTVNWTRFGGQVVLILLAMVIGRTVAMLANRYFDRTFDAANPRTKGRAIPSGRAQASVVRWSLAGSAGAFMIVCASFGFLYHNWWPLMLGLPVLLWISSYGLFKRFTWWCHVFLGSSLAISPIAAALAIEPSSLQTPTVWLLSAMVLAWVAGFDVIYALQDVEVDQRDGLHSIPARFGVGRSMWISRGLHAVSIAALVAMTLLDDRLHIIFATAASAVLILLIIEHATVHRWGTSKIALTFFTLNGIISCVLGGAGIVDVLAG